MSNYKLLVILQFLRNVKLSHEDIGLAKLYKIETPWNATKALDIICCHYVVS
jgi:hypothetical protein